MVAALGASPDAETTCRPALPAITRASWKVNQASLLAAQTGHTRRLLARIHARRAVVDVGITRR
jgi:hypothetical protein